MVKSHVASSTDASARTLTTDHLTRYEIAKLLGLRIVQINDKNLPIGPGLCPEAHALREILDGRNPSVIRRYLPDGTHEDRHVSKLRLPDHLRVRLEYCFAELQVQGRGS